MSRIEVLVSTMNQAEDNLALFNRMNIQTDAVIVNQSHYSGYSEMNNEEGITVKTYSFQEKGVGKSRNSALMRATGDICLMADDDMKYVDGYEDIVKRAYEKYPDADFIVFNVRIHYPDRLEERVKSEGRVRFFNSLKYGTVTFSFKRDAIYKNNIFYSLLFGGGARYGSGEDSLFIWTALKRGLKVYSVKETIADVYNLESSWFEGYTDKYFRDKGALYKALSPSFNFLLNLQFAYRKRNAAGKGKQIKDILKLMQEGARDYKSL